MPFSLLIAGCVLAAAQDPVPSLELRVNRGVARALEWLGKEQKQDGSFVAHPVHPGGATALAGLALLSAGVARDDPRLQGCIRATSDVAWQTTYSAAVNLMFLDALRALKGAEVAPTPGRVCLDFLLANQREGLWGYPHDPIDLSNTQFALLGLRAAKRLGLAVPAKAVEKCAAALVRAQSETGGFPYTSDRPPTMSITSATLAGFAVLAELGKGARDVEALLGKRKHDLARAATWMERRFDATRNAYGEALFAPQSGAGLWAVERWCGLTQREKIGTHDWYREGAEWTLARQVANGSIGGSFDETCFALLFLRRATVTGWRDLASVYREIDQHARAEAARPVPTADASVPRATDWLLAGPWRDEPECALVFAPPFAPERVEPKLGAKIDGKPLARVALKRDGWSNLDEVGGVDVDRSFWVLASWIEVPGDAQAPALPLRLWFALEDPWRTFVDGREVSSGQRVQGAIEEHERVDLELAPGFHALVVVVADERGAAAFSMRVTDREGKAPPAGVRVVAERARGTKGAR